VNACALYSTSRSDGKQVDSVQYARRTEAVMRPYGGWGQRLWVNRTAKIETIKKAFLILMMRHENEDSRKKTDFTQKTQRKFVRHILQESQMKTWLTVYRPLDILDSGRLLTSNCGREMSAPSTSSKPRNRAQPISRVEAERE
jgi:hypothetical protein